MNRQVSKTKPHTLNPKPFPKVFIGLSGGVDSSVSAALLKEAGYDITGVFIRVWQPDWISCTWKEDRLDAMRVCAKLGIPFITLDLEKEYKKEVVDYMIREYKAGRTPNPDVMCNKYVKFGAFFDWAMENGADYVATGHYARVASDATREFPISNFQFSNPILENQNFQYGAGKARKFKIQNPGSVIPAKAGTQGKILRPEATSFNKGGFKSPFSKGVASLRAEGFLGSRFQLSAASDKEKDQSYFLWTLTQKQLSKTLFPVGDLIKKTEVRKLAKKFDLITAEKKDSQGLCFIGKIDFKEFLRNYIKPKKGEVLNENGEVIGEHNGAIFLTIGERHNFLITKKGSNDRPYFVIAKDLDKNTITVSHKNPEGMLDVTSKEAVIGNVNWTLGFPPDLNKKYQARVRYRQPLQEIRIMNYELRGKDKEGGEDKKLKVVFDNPQNAITSGQSLVIYDDEVCLGGGIIK